VSLRVELADRLKNLPPYLFAEIDRQKKEARARGADLVDLGIGDPDLPTPAHVIDALARAGREPKNHRYPDYEGLLAFREAAAGWYRRRFGVSLDPATEVLTLIGSKEGTAHIPLAFVNPGDVVLVPDPGYPVYAAGTWFAGGEPYLLPLRADREFLPDLDAVPADVLRRAKMLFLNYPNNPTAAVATREFFGRVVEFARSHGIIVCHDAMYSELRFDRYEPPSFLQAPGAKEVGVEFHSCSKTYSMTGWRLGYGVMPKWIADAVNLMAVNATSCTASFTQRAGLAALEGPQDAVDTMVAEFKKRRNAMVQALNTIPGFRCSLPAGAFYAFPNITGTKMSSKDLADFLLTEAGVACLSGTAFGQHGDGFLRFSYANSLANIMEAIERIKKVSGKWA
jgi:LL-diaminopimelate aminotransferase